MTRRLHQPIGEKCPVAFDIGQLVSLSFQLVSAQCIELMHRNTVFISTNIVSAQGRAHGAAIAVRPGFCRAAVFEIVDKPTTVGGLQIGAVVICRDPKTQWCMHAAKPKYIANFDVPANLRALHCRFGFRFEIFGEPGELAMCPRCLKACAEFSATSGFTDDRCVGRKESYVRKHGRMHLCMCAHRQ